jgi:hypothetical protein
MDASVRDPQPRANALRELERNAENLPGDPREILLTFMSAAFAERKATTPATAAACGR